MKERATTRLAWSLWTLAMILSVAAVFFLVSSRATAAPAGSFGFRGFGVIFALAFGTVGALMASRKPENSIGWLFLGMGVASGFQELAQEYGIYAVLAHRSAPLALGTAAAWFPSWIWVPITAGVMFLFPLFPGGHLPSRRWRWWLAVGTLGAIVGAFGFAFAPGPLQNFSPVTNPFGVGDRSLLITLSGLGQLTYALVIFAGAFSLVSRFRRARGDEREQIKWLAFSGVFLAVAFSPSFFLSSASTTAAINFASSTLVIVAFVSVPVSVGIAILKYRLYDIDVVINKAVVYFSLAAFITLVYVGIVVGVGALAGQGDKPNVALSIAATGVVAIAFQPVRTRVQRFANRLVYGERATPYEVMADFSHRMAGTLSADEVLPQMAEAAAAGIGASGVRVRMFLPGGGVREITWPSDDDGRGGSETSIAVRYQGEDVGELSVAKPPGETVLPAEEKLLGDLAAQAGLAMRNARLAVELQAKLEEISSQAREIRVSRQRIVAARDAALRQLERDIHGGTQQQLLAISANLRVATDLMEREPERAASMLDDLGVEANEALEALRDLARGIFPPLLADKGLVAALEAHVNKARAPVTIKTHGDIGRYEPGIEAATYFCCIEAIQNASKYAPDAPVTVGLAASKGALEFDVVDSGPGFDTENTTHRSGLQQMADRVEALGGVLKVESSPGHGATVAGIIPVQSVAGFPEAASQASES